MVGFVMVVTNYSLSSGTNPSLCQPQRTFRTTPLFSLRLLGPNAMRVSRRHSSPRMSPVTKMCSISGWNCTHVISASCCSVPWARVSVLAARMSWSMVQPSSLKRGVSSRALLQVS